FGISAGKEVDIGLDEGRDKPLRSVHILLYSWDGGLDVYMDLIRSSPLTQTGMVDFIPGRVVIDVAQRKREADDVTLLKRIRKFSITQDIGARAAGKEVDIGLDEGRDKPLHSVHILLYSWDGGLDVYMDLIRSSPLTQTGMVDFIPGRVVIDVAQRKREADDVTLLKRIRKFSITQDIGARA
nr:hypothetical protein [Tanacetum cinerariifolium]